MDAFVARMRLIDQAKTSIDFKSFIFKDDAVGRVILDKLLEAANRGVKVRLLLDDLWSGNQDTLLSAFDSNPNFEVKLFNPLSRSPFKILQYVFRFGTITRRMHNKALIVDNNDAIAGGRNIALEYFGLEPVLNFADLDVLVKGSVVNELSDSFNAFWECRISIPVSKLVHSMSIDSALKVQKENFDRIVSYEHTKEAHEYIHAAKSSEFVNEVKYEWEEGEVIADSPDKIISNRKRVDLHLSAKMEQLIKSSTQELIIVSPYFLPGKIGLEGLAKKAAEGVRVVIITNSLASNNHSLVHAHYAKYRITLLEAGVEIFEIKRRLRRPKVKMRTMIKDLKSRWRERVLDKYQVLHAKAFLFDQKKLFVGSLNLDPRSWVENTEIGIIINSNTLGNYFSQWVNNEVGNLSYRLKTSNSQNGKTSIVWQTCDGESFYIEPDSSIWKRFKIRMMAWLPVESLL